MLRTFAKHVVFGALTVVVTLVIIPAGIYSYSGGRDVWYLRPEPGCNPYGGNNPFGGVCRYPDQSEINWNHVLITCIIGIVLYLIGYAIWQAGRRSARLTP